MQMSLGNLQVKIPCSKVRLMGLSNIGSSSGSQPEKAGSIPASPTNFVKSRERD